MRFIYLHGFASGPQSTKARFFREKFAERGLKLEIPRLDQDDFKGLTITGQLQVIERAVTDGPAILMGSSLGGYLAALFASRHGSIEKLVLVGAGLSVSPALAAAVLCGRPGSLEAPGEHPGLPLWISGGSSLGFQIVEDAQRYEDEPGFRAACPGLARDP